MLRRYSPPSEGGPPIWIDLLNPTDEEKHQVKAEFGVSLPSREDLSEIESSSRLVKHERDLCMSMPLIPPSGEDDPMAPPLGFVLTPQLLVTVRFSDMHAIDRLASSFASGNPPRDGAHAFIALLECMVDYVADVLERLNEQVATISRRAFRKYAEPEHKGVRSSRVLRATLVAVGSVGEQLSEIRDTLLGLQRIAPFVSESARDWFSKDAAAHLPMIGRDVLSLTEFESHLANKVQFLLDAVLGFINTEQNEIFKVLTIASVVGIPPTLIASMYGMNFKNMPELSWSWGYEYGLALIVISTVLPILWFKSRGWW
jgi:magnesium transporter